MNNRCLLKLHCKKKISRIQIEENGILLSFGLQNLVLYSQCSAMNIHNYKIQFELGISYLDSLLELVEKCVLLLYIDCN